MSTSTRKDDHLRICAEQDVEFSTLTTGFERFALEHCALPELALAEVDTGVTFFGRSLKAPLVISAMTGGTDLGGRINRDLASVALLEGVAFGLGSQRPMMETSEALDSYLVDERDDILLLGNLGLFQARDLDGAGIDELAGAVGADAFCLHLNCAQELVQPEGDRCFLRGASTLSRLAETASTPLMVKETGCGLSRDTGLTLRESGIRHVDVAGAGGTSWTRVERLRCGQDCPGALDEWGIPTATSVKDIGELGFETVIASGGIRTGRDVAMALALGAHGAGIALPLLRAWTEGGREAVALRVRALIEELATVMALTGVRSVADLRNRKPLRAVGVQENWNA